MLRVKSRSSSHGGSGSTSIANSNSTKIGTATVAAKPLRERSRFWAVCKKAFMGADAWGRRA